MTKTSYQGLQSSVMMWTAVNAMDFGNVQTLIMPAEFTLTFYSARTVSCHPRILSWIPHCTVKLKQLREPIF